MNRIIKKGILYFLSLFFVLLLSLLSSGNYVYALGYNENLTIEEKEYYNVEELDISEENVSLDSVIITLTKEETIKFLNYTSDDFSEIGCLSIEDLTMHTVDDVENSYNENSAVTNKMIDYENFRRILKLEISDKSINGVINAIRILMNKDNVLSVVPNYKIHLTALPNDVHYENNDMWGLNGTYGISADNAWDISVGCSEVNVAVIDSGIEYNHPDLKNRINDTNIHRDFTVSATTPIEAVDLTDSDGHGTHVAGIIAGEGNNNSGIVGVAWDVRLVSLKVFENNKGEVSHLCSAINYAADQEIPIINFSGGMYGYEYRLYSALRGYNGLFVCAVGNDSKDVDYDNHYPSHFSYDYDFSNRVISVGSINKKGNRSNFSNYSSSGNRVDIYAPGEDILSTVPYHLCPTGCRGFFHSWSSNHKARGYHYNSGTSMASPFVAGAAAVLLSANNILSAENLKKAIINGADTITIKIPNPTGSGEINQEVLSLNLYNSLKSIAYKVNSDGNIITGIWFNPVNSLNIPDKINGVTITGIGENAFKDISIIESVDLTNGLLTIGNAAFKNCVNLNNIIIPNNVTNIDSSAFENCTSLESVTLSNSLYAIAVGAFKGCSSLRSINIPASVQHIDSNAFENCSSLTRVTVNKSQKAITHIGENAFDGCSTSLQIIVPTNRIAEYKNKEYWLSYRNKIMPSEDYIDLEIDCEGNVTESLSLSKATNELYKLNVNCSKSYKINANSSKTINIIIYDANMNVISSGSNTVTQFLGCGTYYISFEFDDTNASGTFEIGISLTWISSNILLNKGTNNTINSMHLNSENVYHCSYKYLNNQGEGFYRFSLNVGSNIILPEGTIKIYSNINKTELLNRYGSTGINEQAITYNGENELYVFLPENGYYYIDIVLPKSTYSLITLTIEQVEKNDINYQNRLATIGFDELFDNKTVSNYFEEVTISHRSKIELDIVTSGTINRNIPIYIFEKHRDPGYEPGDNHYYLVLEYTNNITSINMGPVFTVILNPGTYYIGYSDNFDKVQIQFALRRKVNTDLNIDGTLVTDPARDQGFPLGSEVIFNNGSLLGNTITEGFTRNLYLMVEDRLRDPMSRLDYDWYSSNENVAKVTKYGTVLALNVSENTTVTIYAINKDDPSIVYKKDFIILKETKTEQIVIECNMSYSYSEENGMYTLELDFTNSPYPYIGYYVWDIECFNGINVDIGRHGLVSSTGPGEALLTANYALNMRISLKIHLTITE